DAEEAVVRRLDNHRESSSVSGEGALLLGANPDELQGRSDELRPGGLGAFGALGTGLGDGRLHDGRTVVGTSDGEGDGSSFPGEAIQAGGLDGTGSEKTGGGRGAVPADVAHCGGPIDLSVESHADTQRFPLILNIKRHN